MLAGKSDIYVFAYTEEYVKETQRLRTEDAAIGWMLMLDSMESGR